VAVEFKSKCANGAHYTPSDIFMQIQVALRGGPTLLPMQALQHYNIHLV